MKTLNEEQVLFIKNLLEDELMRMYLRKSKVKDVKRFNAVCGKRIEYIQDLLEELK